MYILRLSITDAYILNTVVQLSCLLLNSDTFYFFGRQHKYYSALNQKEAAILVLSTSQ